MTREEILRKHDVSLCKTLSRDGTFSKHFLASNVLESYFWLMNGDDNIEEVVIPVIDHYLNGNPFAIDNSITVGSNTLTYVTLTGVDFIDRNTRVIEPTVPLHEFKVICEAWIDFVRNE